MRENEFVLNINPQQRARDWIQKIYAQYPQTWQNNHVMPMGVTGEDQQFAMFELVPSNSKRDAVEVKWFQAYPLHQGVGSRAMKELQDLARADGIALTLYPWDKGQVSQNKLTKFYKGMGFKPINKGGKNMAWDPSVNENFADGKVKGKSRPGRVKRAGASCSGSVTSLRQKAKNSSGERAKMYHWCANMKSGRRKKLNEFSPNTLDGSFTEDLLLNKYWLLSELKKIKSQFSTIYVLGSWYGNMSLLLAKSDIKFDHIVNVDTDAEAIRTGERIADLMGLSDNIESMVKDANELDYRQLDTDGLVINTSCHDMEGHTWFDNIPAGVMVAVQSRTDVDDDLSSYEFAELLYEGSIELTDPETEYTSLLKIGIK